MMTEKCIEAFKSIFNRDSGICAFAPGRVNLIGEHTDYNGGFVLPCAITQGIFGAAAKRSDDLLRLYSLNFEEDGIFQASLDDIQKTGTWADYPLGIANTLLRFGYKLDCGADILFYGNLPNGAGLSSSAAIEVLTAVILRELFSLRIPNNLIAVIGQFAENRFVGVNCGIMDQFAVAMGKEECAVLLDSKSLKYKYLRIPSDKADIVIVNSLVKRELAACAYNERRQECEKAFSALSAMTGADSLCAIAVSQFEQYRNALPEEIQKRAKHAVYENERVLNAASALEREGLKTFGELMNASHKSLKDDFEVSCAQLDFLAETAQKIPGVFGSRMTGAGFGGCTVNLVQKAKTDEFIFRIKKEYLNAFGIEPPVYKTSPSGEARVILKF